MFVAYLSLGLLILLGVIAMLRAYASTSPASLATAVRRTALGSAALGAVLLLFRAPIGFLFLFLGAALPMALRWPALWPRMGRSDGAVPGKTSRIDTKYLSMVLDHDSGTLDGQVLAGRHRDRRLADLTFEQLLEVRQECLLDDPDGVTVMEAYLDRIHGADWRTRETAGSPAAGKMTREEALEILGLESDAGEAEIRDAHHRLMMKLHPDHGGSNYLAAKINQAKDLLLGT
jgi:hypothetical protein